MKILGEGYIGMENYPEKLRQIVDETDFAIIILDDIYFIPFCLIPIGSIYVFRKPEKPKPGVKEVGIILGNIILVYFLVLIIVKLYAS